MNVIVACEQSGVVREAFALRGHKVLSCDLKPSRKHGAHYCGDVFDVADYPWDLAILHPPCTHTAVSGALHFASKWQDGRQAYGVAFALRLWKAFAHVRGVALEQPISVLSTLWRKPDQIIQPWQFGHDASKKTCLWLQGVRPLTPTLRVPPRMVDGKPRWANQTDSGQNRLGPSDERADIRAETYAGIAEAMAEQWGNPNQLRLTA